MDTNPINPAQLETAQNAFESLYINFAYIIALEVLVLAAIIVFGFYVIKKLKQPLLREKDDFSGKHFSSLDELVEQAQQGGSHQPLKVTLGSGDFKVEKDTVITSQFCLMGSGASETKIVSSGEHPAFRIKNAKDCVVSNVRIEGSIQCSNTELLIENCHIVAKDNGICIVAEDGSIVTFSGMMKGEGGIAIHAKGESKVILKPPYAVSGDDYVVIDPKSQVKFESGAVDESEREKPEATDS
jgi:hypothetical protein